MKGQEEMVRIICHLWAAKLWFEARTPTFSPLPQGRFIKFSKQNSFRFTLIIRNTKFLSFWTMLWNLNRMSYDLRKRRQMHSLRTFKKLIYFWLCWVFVAAQAFSLVMVSGSLVAKCRLLIAVVFLAVAHGLQGTWPSACATRGLSSCSSQARGHRLNRVAPGLRRSAAHGIFPGRGLNAGLPHWQVASLPLSHQGSPKNI